MMDQDSRGTRASSSVVVVIAAWIAVGLPMLWGVMMTVKKAALLFK